MLAAVGCFAQHSAKPIAHAHPAFAGDQVPLRQETLLCRERSEEVTKFGATFGSEIRWTAPGGVRGKDWL